MTLVSFGVKARSLRPDFPILLWPGLAASSQLTLFCSPHCSCCFCLRIWASCCLCLKGSSPKSLHACPPHFLQILPSAISVRPSRTFTSEIRTKLSPFNPPYIPFSCYIFFLALPHFKPLKITVCVWCLYIAYCLFLPEEFKLQEGKDFYILYLLISPVPRWVPGTYSMLQKYLVNKSFGLS